MWRILPEWDLGSRMRACGLELSPRDGRHRAGELQVPALNGQPLVPGALNDGVPLQLGERVGSA
jgi:hypothetical protein